MSKLARFWLVGLVWLGAGLRFHSLFFNSFSADEALFASWARLIAVWRDPLLAGQIVDKPPLLFYSQAVFYPLLGAVEWAARMPNLIASLLLIPMTGLLAWFLFREEITALLAAAFVTFSPLAIQFSATAYTDPLLTFLLLASLMPIVCSDRGLAPGDKPLDIVTGAGSLFGLAAATKYQAWLFLPLIVGLALFKGWKWRAWRNWLIGLGAILVLVVAWDVLRTGQITIFGEQMNSYGGLRLAWSWELWPRLEAWAKLSAYFIDSPLLLFALLLALPLFFALLIFEVDRVTSLDQMLVIFVLGYFVFHWFLAIPAWERYLLPILPIVGLVLSRFVFRLFYFFLPSLPLITDYKHKFRRLLWLVPFLLVLVQAPSVINAYYGRLPVGGSPKADEGASQVANALEDAPYGTVLYDHWYSWQWRYHLLDKKVYISWFSDPDALIGDLSAFASRDSLNYLAVPNGAESMPVLRRLSEGGFSLQPIDLPDQLNDDAMILLYRIDSD